MFHKNDKKNRHENDAENSNVAVADRPENTPEKQPENDGRISTKIRKVAADILEQSDHRGREMIERDLNAGTSADVQRALITAILMHLDGKDA